MQGSARPQLRPLNLQRWQIFSILNLFHFSLLGNSSVAIFLYSYCWFFNFWITFLQIFGLSFDHLLSRSEVRAKILVEEGIQKPTFHHFSNVKNNSLKYSRFPVRGSQIPRLRTSKSKNEHFDVWLPITWPVQFDSAQWARIFSWPKIKFIC